MPVIKELLELDSYGRKHDIPRIEIAKRLQIPYSSLKKWYQHGKWACKPSDASLGRIRNFLKNEDAKHRVDKIKYILLLLEDEISWFKDSDYESRDVFRREINPQDIGYISSLLTMLTEEDKFQRWLSLTTTQFQFFKKR